MTPKEKSAELLERFHRCMYHDMGEGKMGYVNMAKQCAIICVEQIIDLPVCWYSKDLADKNDEEYPHSATEEYWQEVLSHLKNS